MKGFKEGAEARIPAGCPIACGRHAVCIKVQAGEREEESLLSPQRVGIKECSQQKSRKLGIRHFLQKWEWHRDTVRPKDTHLIGHPSLWDLNYHSSSQEKDELSFPALKSFSCML